MGILPQPGVRWSRIVRTDWPGGAGESQRQLKLNDVITPKHWRRWSGRWDLYNIGLRSKEGRLRGGFSGSFLASHSQWILGSWLRPLVHSKCDQRLEKSFSGSLIFQSHRYEVIESFSWDALEGLRHCSALVRSDIVKTNRWPDLRPAGCRFKTNDPRQHADRGKLLPTHKKWPNNSVIKIAILKRKSHFYGTMSEELKD